MTSKFSTAYGIGTWRRRAATWRSRFVLSPLITIWSVVWYLMVFAVLALYLLPDLFPKRASKPLTSQKPMRRKLQLPQRDYDRIYIVDTDGTEVDLTVMEAKLQFMAWADVFSGYVVYEKTRIPAKD